MEGSTSCELCGTGTYLVTGEDGETNCETCPAGHALVVLECKVCLPGTYNPVEGGECLPCAPGLYSEGNASLDCLPCEAGTFSPMPGMSECFSCPTGLFGASNGASACSNCTPGVSTTLEGSQTECVCLPGFFSQDGICRNCSAGAFSTGFGETSCRSCRPGTYSSRPGRRSCLECSRGQYSSLTGGSTCFACLPGRFAGWTGLTACLACGMGEYAGEEMALACTSCEPGRYSQLIGGTGCGFCLAGTFSQGKASACQLCPPGQFAPDSEMGACLLCEPGKYVSMLGALECENCARGYYSVQQGQTSMQECLRCPSGQTNYPGSSACDQLCDIGEFPNVYFGACSRCPTHSPTLYPGVPEDCACDPGYRPGYNTRGLGGLERYAGTRKIHEFPAEGQSFVLIVATLLTTRCIGQPETTGLFEPGTYPVPGGCTLSYGVDAVLDPAQTETYMQCVPCPPGKFSSTGEECRNCPVGTYQDEVGSSICKECATNSPAAGEGLTTCVLCSPPLVPRDGACRPCPDGQFYPLYLQGVCLDCPAGMWSDQVSGGCQLCPEFSTSPGGTGRSGCACRAGWMMTRDYRCVMCPAGQSSVSGGMCQNCPNGTFAARPGMGLCEPCPGGMVSSNGATVCEACPSRFTPSPDRGSCVICPAGMVCYPDGQVIPCPTGTYSLATGLTSPSQCPLCPRNHACPTPTTLQQCPAHTTSPVGTVNLHGCVCDRGFRCHYSFSTRGQVRVSHSGQAPDQQALILAIARAAGVDPGRVEILEVQRA